MTYTVFAYARRRRLQTLTLYQILTCNVRHLSCPRENRQLAVSLADLMMKWEAHGRERVRLRRAANATATSVTPAAAAAGDPAKGTKRALEGGTEQPAAAENGAVAADGAAAAAASPGTAGQQQQGREKVMKTATGAAPGAGAGAVVPAREGSSAAGGGGVAEGTTDSYRLSKSAVRRKGPCRYLYHCQWLVSILLSWVVPAWR